MRFSDEMVEAGAKAALDMIAEGYLPTEIAREVGVTPHTVNKWKRQMVRKLYWEQQAA